MNVVKNMTHERVKKPVAILLLIAMLMSLITPFQTDTAYAADDDLGVGDVVHLELHHQIRYGEGDGGYSNLMKAIGIDDSLGDRYVFCTQPHMPTPEDGNYKIDKMYTGNTGNAAMLRKLVYYAKGYPGWSKGQDMWFDSGTWSNDDIYGIFHVAISYVTAGYDDKMEAWGGGTVKEYMYTKNWNKMKEIVEDCKSDTKVPDAPKGFKCFYIIKEGYQNVIGGTLEYGNLKLTKKSAVPEVTNGNDAYSFKGAEFGVYKSGTKVGTLITDADGKSNTLELDAGTYTVKEDKVPKGYAKAPDQTVKVKAGQTSTVTFEDYPKDDPIGIVLRKGDSELGTNKAQGKATLAGAVYEIKYYKHTDDGNKLDRTWRVITNANGIAHLSEDDLDPSFDNDEFYYSAAGDPCFPLGTVTVQEVKAPTGYEKNSQIYTCKITGGSGTTESVSTYNIPKIGSDEEMAEDVKRGDLEFVKVADGTLERLAGVPFKITSLTTGESHVIVTDKNGYASTASSWNKHTNNTNRGKYSTDGIWFGEGAPDNSKGALIYDDYVIEEQPCDANKGMNLLSVTVSIYKNNVTVPLGTLTDDQIEISTTAKDEDSDSHIGMVQETVYIKDTVEYKGLKKGETYRLEGKLMNKETGKAITAGGKAVTAETTFTPKMTDGQVDVEFEVPGSAVRGKALVVFEDLFLGDIKLATHADIDDEGQTVYYPDVTTKAKDNETKAGVAKADGKVTLVDTVSYSGVMTGKKYTVIGTLMDKATGKPVLNGEKEVTASAEFTPKAMSGTVDVTFTFDGRHLKGKEVVVFETLKYHNREVAYHQDLKDDGQTIFFPEIGTTAKDSETKIGVSNPDKSVTLVDTVSYEGLRPGLEYKVTGTLMDKATGDAVQNVTAETTFTPVKSKGTVDVTFNFNGRALEGKSVVVYETLTYKGIELADHKDINDDGQTIYFPDIWTTAKDTEFDDHISMADEDVTIVDKVSYEGLRPGVEYKVVGTLMDKDTGEPVKVNGADVRAEAKFTPKDSKGSVNVTFNFTGVALKGTTTVVFETLYYKDNELAVHTDLSDADQTVYIPEIKTSAKDSETRVGVGRADDQITLIDTVSYTDLLPEREYTVIGQLMNKETGKPYMNGDKAVTASAVFTPEKSSGKVNVTFVFEGKDLKGKSLVVYETLQYKGKDVAVHHDMKADGQTVYFPDIRTTAKDSETKIGLGLADSQVTIVDTVSYEGVRPGLEYIVKGTLMDKTTGKAVKIDGKNVTAQSVFTPDKTKGMVDVTFKFNGKSLEGSTVVVFEKLYYGDALLAEHADIKDDGQTIYLPEIGTTAKDFDIDDHIGRADEDVTIVDTVKYEHLRPGLEYKVVGKLMNKKTGKIIQAGGKDVTAETTFTAKDSSGSVKVTFNFNGVNLKGETVVAFETLYYKDIPVAVHAEIGDDGQTVYLPEIRTSAIDSETGVGLSKADGKIILTDTVSYTDVLPGKEYTVIGVLMDKATGEPVVSAGRGVTAETVFTALDVEGTVDVVFEFDGSDLAGKTTVVFESLQYKGKEVAFHTDLNDDKQTVYIPEIKTSAIDADTRIGVGRADDHVTIVDTVSYEGLRPGLEYKMVGTLMDKETGKPVESDGKVVTAETIFTPDKSAGKIDVVFDFNAEDLAGTTTVVFENLYYKDVEVAVHADFADDGQTVYLPDIATTAKDSETKNHISMADEEITIIDTVDYTDLRPGVEYKVSGKLMNKETGEAILVDEKEVTAETVFTPEKPDGSVDITFVFNGVSLEGETIVAFESLTYKNYELAVHADIDDEAQTVYVPEIRTSAVDSETRVGVGKADEKITLIDTVSYTDLMPGAEYTVKGILMDKATGEPVVTGGSEVTAETKFTAESTEGTVDVVFEFDARDAAGKTTVVFETLYFEDHVVAVHRELDDDGQTVYLPEIGTKAIDADTNIGVSRADELVTIKDTVSYEGLRPNLEYKVVGTLMNKETGKPVEADGRVVTSEVMFTPEESEGSIELTFEFDGSDLAGTTTVVFEQMYYKDVEVAVHACLEDDNQTVYMPDIATTAKDSETMNHVSMADEEITIVDTVDYTDLRPGVEYKVSGKLMNKATGEPVMVDDKEVTAETIFTPEKPDGSVDITFIFNGVSLEGETVVAFESLFYKDYELAVHADINDEAQTVYIPEIRTSAKDSETGIGISKADDKIKLTDTVTYNNLMPGSEYVVKGTLMDKKTGEPVKANGKDVTAETKFTAENTDGTVDVIFEFDGRTIAGKTTVVFESLLFEDKEVAVHADLADDAQTVYIPEIKTSAKDFETDIAVSNPDPIVNIIDIVTYEGLRPGLEYKVTGVLMDKATGKPLMVDGMKVMAEEVFTPESSKGAVGMVFSFDGSGLEGKTVVAFESVTHEGMEVGVHADINDQAQSIFFPDIRTSAKDKADGDKKVYAQPEVTIVDTVEYENLVAGKTYTVKGILMDKASGKAVKIGGKEVTAEKSFRAKETAGSIELEFKFDADKLEGKSLVVFEKLYYGEDQIGAHEDLKDKAQTVEVIKLLPAPETGDNNNLKLYLALALGALLLGSCFVIEETRRKKKHKNKDEE